MHFTLYFGPRPRNRTEIAGASNQCIPKICQTGIKVNLWQGIEPCGPTSYTFSASCAIIVGCFLYHWSYTNLLSVVLRAGFEPASSDWESEILNLLDERSVASLYVMVVDEGFEPSTFCKSDRCSTPELIDHNFSLPVVGQAFWRLENPHGGEKLSY